MKIVVLLGFECSDYPNKALMLQLRMRLYPPPEFRILALVEVPCALHQGLWLPLGEGVLPGHFYHRRILYYPILTRHQQQLTQLGHNQGFIIYPYYKGYNSGQGGILNSIEIWEYYRFMIKKLIVVLAVVVVLAQSACVVTELKNAVNNSLVFAGNASVSASSTNNLYFLFYGAYGVIDRSQLKTHPTLVVFGNPGSSSHYINFGGLGPLTLTDDLTLTPNPYAASNYANLLFIDPLGVGFSIADSTKNIPTSYLTMSQQVAYALKEFKKNVDFAAGKWIFVGESSWIRSINGLQDLDDNLIGIIALSPWGDLYDNGKYAGVAGVEMGLLSNSEKNTIESTFTTCYLYIKNGKYNDAHKCYDETLNFVETKTSNRNLYNINLNSTLISMFAKVQYYLSQQTVASSLLAPTSGFFESQANFFQGNVYAEQAQNYSQNITNFMRDYLSVKYLFVSGNLDYITYYKATRSWLESLNFKDVAQFKSKPYENITLNGNVIGVGKEITQVKYVELDKSGHYPFIDQPATITALIRQWVEELHPQEFSSPSPTTLLADQ